MKLNEYIKRRIYFLMVTLLIICCSVGASTYCFSQNNINSKSISHNVNSNLVIEYVNGSDLLSVSEYPISNEVGSIYAPSNVIRVINKTNKVQNYAVVIKPTELNEITDLNKIFVSINKSAPQSLSSLKDGNLNFLSLDKNSKEILDIRIWVSKEYIEESDLGKNLGLRLYIAEK